VITPDHPVQRHLGWFGPRSSSSSLHRKLAIGWSARESFDAPEHLPKQVRRQVVLSKQEDEVPVMPDQASAGLEHPLLQVVRDQVDRFGPVRVVTMKRTRG
jgi:hypothetical protein